MRNPGKDNSFIEVEVIDKVISEEKQAEISSAQKKLMEVDDKDTEDADELSFEMKKNLGLIPEDAIPGQEKYEEVYITEDDLIEVRYKKYIRKDLRVMITDKGESEKSFLDIDGEVSEVSDKVQDLLKKFAQ